MYTLHYTMTLTNILTYINNEINFETSSVLVHSLISDKCSIH